MMSKTTSRTPSPVSRRGMTVIELVIALVVFGVIISLALGALASTNGAYHQGVDRMSSVRSIRYAMSTLERNLETLGTNVPVGQPEFVYGGPDVIAFTADYATHLTTDPFAVYRDPGLLPGQVVAPRTSVAIPNSSRSFPDILYEVQPGVPSPAELIVFFLAPDTTTSEPEDYILWRQVNAGTPERVAGGLRRHGAEPFFSYLRLGRGASGGTELRPVADSLIPIFHSEPAHLSAADTAESAVGDSVRAVRVTLAAMGRGAEPQVVPLSRLIALPNAGLGTRRTCGSTPILGRGLVATPATLPSGDPVVTLTWAAAVDEAQGELDVVRYLVWRRPLGGTDWGDPYVALPAGGAPYTWDDEAVAAGQMFEYGLAAQDCTPSLSPITASNPVVIP